MFFSVHNLSCVKCVGGLMSSARLLESHFLPQGHQQQTGYNTQTGQSDVAQLKLF